MGLIALSAMLGCGSQPARTYVSGKVTFDGEPVKSGQIVFEPLGPGRVGIAQIAEGAYSMPAERGPSPGKYIVRITANRPTGQQASAAMRGARQAPVDVVEQFIPASYNDRSELSIEIGGEGAVERDFELTSE
jgi:hypothetical protein